MAVHFLTAQTLDVPRDLSYFSLSPKISPTLNLLDLVETQYISGTDALHFIDVLTKFQQTYGDNSCWCLRKANNLKAFKGFTTSNNARPLYKGQDARILLLASTGQLNFETHLSIVRHGHCKSAHCLNPTHYFYGDKRDVALQRHARNGSPISPEMISTLRGEHSKGRSYASIARDHCLPYHVVRRICTNESFA